MGWDFDRARSKGIDIQQVANSWAKHLSKERQRLRDNPRLLDAGKPPESYSLAVTQEHTASGVRWRSLGEMPHGVGELTVSASSMDAARNKQSLRSLLEQRYKTELASALMREGVHPQGLDGRRAAMAAAIASTISVVDLAEAGQA
jgi:hypothetical protein